MYIVPYRLSPEQVQAVKTWAADDRLWTTGDTVEFNLATFARVVLKEAEQTCETLRAERDSLKAELSKYEHLQNHPSI